MDPPPPVNKLKKDLKQTLSELFSVSGPKHHSLSVETLIHGTSTYGLSCQWDVNTNTRLSVGLNPPPPPPPTGSVRVSMRRSRNFCTLYFLSADNISRQFSYTLFRNKGHHKIASSQADLHLCCLHVTISRFLMTRCI